MSSTLIAALILASSCTALLLCIALRHRLPPHHEDAETRDVIKIATGMLATLVALILGLLVSSAKGTFDTATAEITRIGAQIITINATLTNYGPDAKPVRLLLQRDLAASIEHLWPEQSPSASRRPDINDANTDALADAMRSLTPRDDLQKSLQTKAQNELSNLAEARWLIYEQLQNPLPTGLLLVLGSWMALLFAGLGLIAPRNPTAVFAMLASAVSMAAAVFLILELNRPLDGFLKVSSAPLKAAARVIGK